MLATQGIRGGENRTVLERIKGSGEIFEAWSDHEWLLDGAAVNVSIVCFDAGAEKTRTLNGRRVNEINSDLAVGSDVTSARVLSENVSVAFRGNQKGGAFDIEHSNARRLLGHPNPNGKSNLDVLRPYLNGMDMMRRPRGQWLIDFGIDATIETASCFEEPFRQIEDQVKPSFASDRRTAPRSRWWLHERPRPELRSAIQALTRYAVVPHVAKHFAVMWLPNALLPDHQLIAFARNDDYFFGAISAAIHEVWARRTGTQLEDRPRYTPSSCFETFPLPWPPGKEDAKLPAYLRIAEAAKTLNEQRERWLNPPEWIEPLAAKIDAADTFDDVPKEARALVRQSAIMAAAAKDARLKKRTLTNLYNERPTWLKLAHEKLDRSVLAAYAATDPEGDWSEDWAAVWVDTGAGQPLPADHPLAAKRAEIDQKVLANLLRLNHARAKAVLKMV